MKRIALPLLLLLAALLAACSSSKEDDVRAWMVAERNQTKPRVAPITAPKQFIPEPYTNAAAIEPFSNLKLTQALKHDSAQAASNGALVAPDPHGRARHTSERSDAAAGQTGGQHHRGA